MIPAVLMKNLNMMLVCTVSLLIAGTAASPVYAEQSGDNTAEIGYYVRAILPENQMDQSVSYFDLRTTPGQIQKLWIEVVNESERELVIDMETVSASTNRNGIIDYKTLGIKDKTLKIPFSDIAAPEKDVITVWPGDTIKTAVIINAPEESYDGVILGGIVFTGRDADGEAETDGMMIKNRYSYVIGVKLSDNDTPVQPEFELDEIEARTVNHYPAVVHQIRNKNAAIAKHINLKIIVTDEAGNIVADIAKSAVSMAPNSVMPFAVTLTGIENSRFPGELPAGNYTSEIFLEYEGEEITFREAYTIGSVQTDILNAAVPEAQFQEKQENPWIIAIFASIITFLLMSLLFLWLGGRDKKR